MSQTAVQRTADTDLSLFPELVPILAALERLGQVVELLAADRAPLQQPMAVWIPLKQAAEYTGLSEGLLRRLIQARMLHGVTDGCTKVRKAELDTLDPEKFGELPKARPRKRGARK